MDMIECETLFGQKKMVPKDKVQFRPSVYGIVLHEEKVLLVKSWRTGKFLLPGGGQKIDETIEATLKREILEETGISISDPIFVRFAESFFYYDPLEEAYHGLMFIYHCRPKAVQLISSSQVDDTEATSPQWVPIHQLKPDDLK